MTKDEILKRFEFDVSVGKLKGYVPNDNGEVICPFDRYDDNDEIDKEETLEYIAKIFRKLGFELDNCNRNLGWTNADGISINLTTKKYFYYELYGDDIRFKNQIPEYLEEYMEQIENEEKRRNSEKI